jgi:methionyl aminopeptidase
VTITNQDELDQLKDVGRIVSMAMYTMADAMEPGMTTAELDAVGAAVLDLEGARSAPAITYGFPGATCISINEAIAHGVPGTDRIRAGDLVNIDVSAEKNGYFADTGASFAVPPVQTDIDKLCVDGRKALMQGIKTVKAGSRLSAIGASVEKFAHRNGYTLIKNLTSHGVGSALHEEPTELATWRNPGDKRRVEKGMVFTIEPFLSMGSEWAVDAPPEAQDEWTLYSDRGTPTVQYEHTLVATDRGTIIVT